MSLPIFTDVEAKIDLKELHDLYFGEVKEVKILRRKFPKLLAKELISVQPMEPTLLPDLIEALKEAEEAMILTSALPKDFIKEKEFKI